VTSAELSAALWPLLHGPLGELPTVGRLPEDVQELLVGWGEPADVPPGAAVLAPAPAHGPGYAVGEAYLAHPDGFTAWLCRALGARDAVALGPRNRSVLRKLAVFVPETHLSPVRAALAAAGAGHIGNYRDCTFTAHGQGTFTPLEGAQPFIGAVGRQEVLGEAKLESVYPAYREQAILQAMRDSHPYEEIAYDIYDLRNPEPTYGGARSATVPEGTWETLLERVQSATQSQDLRYCAGTGSRTIRRVVCLSASADAEALGWACCDAVVAPTLAPRDAAQAFAMGTALIEVRDLPEIALAWFVDRLRTALPPEVRIMPVQPLWRAFSRPDGAL